VLVLPLRVCPDDQTATAIKEMTFIPGDKGTPYGKDCILTLGGQRRGEPEALSLLSLEPEGPEDVMAIPWFGNVIAHTLVRYFTIAINHACFLCVFCLICIETGLHHRSIINVLQMASGSASSTHVDVGLAPGPAIMILTEGGQLIVHDLASWEPSPLSLKFQELPPITCTKFVASLDLDGIHVPSLKEMRYLSLNYATDSRWPFHGGVPPANYFNSEVDYMSAGSNVAHPSAMLACGHRDGRVRFWDATSEVPRYLVTVPASAALIAGEGRIQAVTCMDVCPVSGIMAVGHSGGLVRIYQFSKTPQAVRKVTLDESLVPYDTLLDQPAGWQYVMKYSNHTNCVTSVTLNTKSGILVVGDASGGLSLVDLNTPRQISHAQISSAVFKSCVARVQQDFDDPSDSNLEYE
jgi:WD40 repeat protein